MMVCARCPEPLAEDESVDNPLGPGLLHDDCRSEMLRADQRCVVCAEPMAFAHPVCGPCSAGYVEDMR